MTETIDHQQYNIGVKALIINNHRVLLLQRNDFDTWDAPGGRINRGEKIHSALLRELSEELPQSSGVGIGGIVHAEAADFELTNGNRLMLLFFQVSLVLPYDFKLSSEHRALLWANDVQLAQLPMQPLLRTAAEIAILRAV
jgi:8-oxo-dGTP pyrophosphatase MutT (NUDIX family)